MEKHKIAFAIHAIGEGGAERVITILCTRFVEKGYEVHLITNHRRNWEYPVSPLVKRHVIGENVSTFRSLASFQRISRLREICKREDFDILLAFMSMNEYSVFATAGLRTKNVISLRNAIEKLYPSPFKRYLIINFLATASGAVFQTDEALHWFPKKFQARSTVIFNPVWSQFYQVKRQAEPGLLVASGRLVGQKNYPMMLRAFAEVASCYHVRLEIYGNGGEREHLKNLAKQLGIESKVKFCGQSNDVPSVLARAEMYLMSSDYEGLPNALMEAMAVGLPCVCTDCLGGGPKILLGNNERGLLTRRGDKKGFADAIKQYLESPQLKQEMSQAAKEYSKQYSIDTCFSAWGNYVEQIIKKNNMAENAIFQVSKHPVLNKLVSLLPDKYFIKLKWYGRRMPYKLNLKNPQSFNEKLQWIKLYDHNPLYTTLVDKYRVKEYVRDRIGEDYVIPLLGAWDSVDDIEWDDLPNQFVLKVNHDCGGQVICKDKASLNIETAKNKMERAFAKNYYYEGREWPYKNVKPKVFAEAYMEDEFGELRDYKFFCFNGEVKAMFVATDRTSGEEVKFDFFDSDYNHLPFTQGHPNALKLPVKPKGFEEMKRLAAELSKGIPEVRVDFYDVNGHVYFGEFTLFHFGGIVEFHPVEWDYTFGSWIKLPENR